MYKLSCKLNNNLRISKETNIYRKSNAVNVAYQQRIRIVFFFNSKLDDCAVWNNVPGELANKTDNRTSYKHRKGRVLVQIK